MSKETREKMGEVARTARNLLDVISNDDSSPEIDDAADILSAAISEFEEHLYGTVAAVIEKDEAAYVTVAEADAIIDLDAKPAPVDPDDEIPF